MATLSWFIATFNILIVVLALAIVLHGHGARSRKTHGSASQSPSMKAGELALTWLSISSKLSAPRDALKCSACPVDGVVVVDGQVHHVFSWHKAKPRAAPAGKTDVSPKGTNQTHGSLTLATPPSESGPSLFSKYRPNGSAKQP